MLQPGQSLQQRPYYVIEEEIGSGGFGVTYKAKHEDLNLPVVIKTPNSRLCRDANYPKYVEGFRKEGRRLADITQLQHPNIVRITDVGWVEERNPTLQKCDIGFHFVRIRITRIKGCTGWSFLDSSLVMKIAFV